jgi:uncharacterized membrane protein
MTDAPNPAETPDRAPRRLRLLLAASLALNLLGGGYLAGSALRAWRSSDAPAASVREALRHAPEETRERLRALAREREGAFADLRGAADAARARAMSVAGAEPLDAEALAAALSDLRRIEGERAALRHAALVETMATLPPEARRAFLARLDRRHGHGDRR